jgi:hypothetical protein
MLFVCGDLEFSIIHNSSKVWIFLNGTSCYGAGRSVAPHPNRSTPRDGNRYLSVFRPWGVPGPTSKLSLRAPAQMGRRETGHREGKTAASCCPAPRVDALAVGGYKRSRGRWREPVRQPVLPRGHLLRTRALDLPFIDVRRDSRCTMGV